MSDGGDVRDKARQDRNWFERILHAIPGFKGYLEKEERRETDKLLRDHLAGRIDRLRSKLDPVMRDLTDRGGMDMLGLVNEVDRAKKAMERVRGRIQHASYGYAGLFDAVKVREQELDRLYAFDAGLIETVETLEKKVGDLADPAKPAAELTAATDDLIRFCRELDTTLDGREQLLQKPAPHDESTEPTEDRR